MKKGYKVIIALGLLGGLYYAYTKVKPLVKKFLLKFEELSKLQVELDQDDIVITDPEGVVVAEYISQGYNMEFPLYNTGQPYTSYDNVAKLQTFLVFSDIDDLTIDGKYGPNTEAAVMIAVTDIGSYGYELDGYDFSEVTESYYDQVVIPGLEEFINNQ